MENKDYFINGLGILGWLWAVIQFNLNRKYQKNDKLIERRFEVYLKFMNQMDEISMNMRKNPNVIYGISNEFLAEALTGDEERVNNALLKFNENFLESTKASLQPLKVVNSELNKIKLVASNKLYPKIIEYKTLVNDYSDEFQSILDILSTKNDIQYNAKQLQSLGHEERAKRMTILWQEIEILMRDEINYYKK